MQPAPSILRRTTVRVALVVLGVALTVAELTSRRFDAFTRDQPSPLDRRSSAKTACSTFSRTRTNSTECHLELAFMPGVPQRLQEIRSPVGAGSGTTTSWRTQVDGAKSPVPPHPSTRTVNGGRTGHRKRSPEARTVRTSCEHERDHGRPLAGYVSSSDSSGLRGVRASAAPRVPALPSPSPEW